MKDNATTGKELLDIRYEVYKASSDMQRVYSRVVENMDNIPVETREYIRLTLCEFDTLMNRLHIASLMV